MPANCANGRECFEGAIRSDLFASVRVIRGQIRALARCGVRARRGGIGVSQQMLTELHLNRGLAWKRARGRTSEVRNQVPLRKGHGVAVTCQEKRPSQVRLNEFWTGVDVNLAQERVAGVNESMRCFHGNNDDASSALTRDCPITRRFPSGFAVYPPASPLRRIHLVMRHSNKRQLREIDGAHGGNLRESLRSSRVNFEGIIRNSPIVS